MTNQRYVFSLIVCLLLAGCAGKTPPTPTPTAIVGAGEAAVAFFEQSMYQNLTQQAIDNERIRQAAVMTATQQVIHATATQQAHLEAAVATRRADSATQQAWQVTVSAAKTADAAETQAAHAAATATKEVASTATAQHFLDKTATAEFAAAATADYKTQQAPIEAAKARALEIETRKAELDLKRSQDTYWLSAYGGWIIALLLVAALWFVLWKKSEIGVIADENGKVRMVLINKRALQPELMFNPVLDFSRKDLVTVPVLHVSDETQRQIVHETKIVDAIRALPPGYPRQAMGMAAGLTARPAPAVNIQVVQPHESGLINQWDADIQSQMAQEVQDD